MIPAPILFGDADLDISRRRLHLELAAGLGMRHVDIPGTARREEDLFRKDRPLDVARVGR